MNALAGCDALVKLSGKAGGKAVVVCEGAGSEAVFLHIFALCTSSPLEGQYRACS